jgi:hypothetical protein
MTVKPTAQDVDLAARLAIETLDKLVAIIDETDAAPDDTTFSMWCNLTHMLALSGWRPDELAREAAAHATIATTEGNA